MITVIHDLVLQTHRKEKLLLHHLDPKTNLPLCPSCNLPRLLDPPLAISQPAKNQQYCSHVPWSTRPGFDIYNNPFPVPGSDKPPTKKEREARLKAETGTPTSGKKNGNSKDGSGTPASQEQNGTAPPSPSAGDQPNTAGPVDKKAAKVAERLTKGAYIPWHTCPSCKRSLLITRFAQHLEKCLGIGGRQAGRLARLNAAGTANGTPVGSRSSTPVPGRERSRNGNGDGGGSEEDEIAKPGGVRKKVLKKGLKQGLSRREEKGAGSAGKRGEGKRLGKGDAKRERDEDEDATPVRKKMRLQRMGSQASVQTSRSQKEGSVDESFLVESSDED